MSTIDDVQDAMVAVLEPSMYPDTTSLPSIAGSYISGITVTDGGTGYTTATVTITGDGTGATALATIVSGVITAITVLNPGIGYSTASVVITGDGDDATATAALADIDIVIASGDFLKADLDDGLAARKIFIAVFAVQGMTRNTTRVRREWVGEQIDTATLTATVLNDTVTIGGTVTVGQAVMIIVNDIGYSYAAETGDTLADIATELADLIPTATSLGAVVTIPNIFNLVARVSVEGTVRRILESQESVFRVRIYAPDYPSRALVGREIPILFGTLGDQDYPGGTDYYLQMPDGVAASVKPRQIAENNMFEMDNAFVRDFLYLVEYHTVQVDDFHTVTDAFVEVSEQVTPLS